MQFGWLTLAHSPSPEHDARGIFEQLEQATLAEELGFDGVWLTEHNFTARASTPTRSRSPPRSRCVRSASASDSP